MENALNQQVSGFFSRSSAGPSIWKKINNFRDSGTHADEWLIVFKALLAISVFFTLGYGMALVYNLLLPLTGKPLAIIAALLFGVFLELGKIITGRWFFRDVLFGLFKQGASSAGMLLMAFLIATSAFIWSYHNSTKGVQYLTKYVSFYLVQRTEVKAQTNEQEKTAADASETAKKGLGITWKGKTTREGQKIAATESARALEAEKQKTLKMSRAEDEQRRADAHRDGYIDNVAYVLAMLGGKMEFFQLFLLLGIVLAEKTLYDRMKATGRIPAGQNLITPPPAAFQPNPGAFYNEAAPAPQTAPTPRPIGYNVDETGNVPKAVTGLPGTALYHTVPQSEPENQALGADQVIKHAKTLLGRDVANLRNGNGEPRTVAGRMHRAINECGRAMQQRGFTPDPILATQFYVFMHDTVFPVLASYKRQYEYYKEFLTDLHQYIDENELGAMLAQEEVDK